MSLNSDPKDRSTRKRIDRHERQFEDRRWENGGGRWSSGSQQAVKKLREQAAKRRGEQSRRREVLKQLNKPELRTPRGESL